MLAIEQETLIELTDAAEMLPRPAGKEALSHKTLRTWARRGVRGVKLEVIRVGKYVMTSREAVRRFIDRLNAPAQPKPAANTATGRKGGKR